MLFIFISEKIDLWHYRGLVDLNNLIQNIYLKNFFIKITELGDSLWYFIISFSIFILTYLLKNKIKSYNEIKNFSLLLFLSILITGILTQIIKHIVGRARPNHTNNLEFSEFNFFTFDSSFHSFPSGHSSTIFTVALVLSLFTPKLKYFYFIWASIIAFSRVVVNAHFFTDIIAGAIIALIGFRITLYIFQKFKINFILSTNLNKNYFFLSTVIIFMFVILITVGGDIDIYISESFYLGGRQFYLQSFDLVTIFMRKFFLNFLILYLLVFPFVALFFPIQKIYLNYNLKLKESLFVTVVFLFNMLVVVNALLKNLWGRARPNDVVELGGKDKFTYWYEISNACVKNCSFVSGDAAVGFSVIILFFITKNKVFIWLALIFGFSLGFVRILEGGHYLSDVIVGGFLVFLLSFFQFHFYKKRFLKA